MKTFSEKLRLYLEKRGFSKDNEAFPKITRLLELFPEVWRF
jgi:hypothetical protein